MLFKREMSAPRSMKLEVLRRRMSAFLLEEYSMATWLGLGRGIGAGYSIG